MDTEGVLFRWTGLRHNKATTRWLMLCRLVLKFRDGALNMRKSINLAGCLSIQKLNRDDFDLVSELASDLIKLCILKPAAKAKYRAEEVSAFLGDHPPLSPPRPTKNGGAILINLAKSDTIS